MIKHLLFFSRIFCVRIYKKILIIAFASALIVSVMLSVQLYKDYFRTIDFCNKENISRSIIINHFAEKTYADYQYNGDIVFESLMDEIYQVDGIESAEIININSYDATDVNRVEREIRMYDYSDFYDGGLIFTEGEFGSDDNAIVLSENAKGKYSVGDSLSVQISYLSDIFDGEGNYVESITEYCYCTYLVTGFFEEDCRLISFSSGSNPPNANNFFASSFSLTITEQQKYYEEYYVGIVRSFVTDNGEECALPQSLSAIKVIVDSEENISNVYDDLASRFSTVGYFTNGNEAVKNYMRTNRIQLLVSIGILCISLIALCILFLSDIHINLTEYYDEYKIYILLGNTVKKLRCVMITGYCICLLIGWMISLTIYNFLISNIFQIQDTGDIVLISLIAVVIVIISMFFFSSVVFRQSISKYETNNMGI